MPTACSIDVVIFGGGAAGLWLLDELTRADYSTLLLEACELGSGQTIASQGIVHGGLKYTLRGLLTPSARAISEMPTIWRRCLAGESRPDLSNTRLRAEYCHLWRTSSIRSRLAMAGARAGLRVAPVALAADERPAILADCPGTVARLDEQVIEPASFVTDLSHQHRPRIVKFDFEHGLEFTLHQPGEIDLIRLINPDSGDPADIRARAVVFAAGAGNRMLRKMAGLSDSTMQRRPLHMVMAKGGSLPVLNGHCVDGAETRITITSTSDAGDRTVWQIGGKIAEVGVNVQPPQLIAQARAELQAVLPGIDLRGVQWATYRVDRAEPATPGNVRPDDCSTALEGNVITAWPIKMALAPELARRVMAIVRECAKPPATADRRQAEAIQIDIFNDWPRPLVALPPWETPHQWFTDL